jgi:hypothetical protein
MSDDEESGEDRRSSASQESTGSGVFARAYRRGVTDALSPSTSEDARAVESFRVRRGGRGMTVAAAAGEAFALRGAVITPDAAWDDGYVVVDGDSIRRAPSCGTPRSGPWSAGSPRSRAPPAPPSHRTANRWSATSTCGSSGSTGPAP